MSNHWYFAQNGQRLGPYTAEQFQALIANGTVTPDDYVWNDQLTDFIPARQVPGLLFPYAVSAPPPPPPLPRGPSLSPVGYYSPPVGYGAAAKYPRGMNPNLEAGDWVVAVLCSGIGCIVGIVRLLQGKPNGGKMLGYSLLFMFIWTIIRVALSQL